MLTALGSEVDAALTEHTVKGGEYRPRHLGRRGRADPLAGDLARRTADNDSLSRREMRFLAKFDSGCLCLFPDRFDLCFGENILGRKRDAARGSNFRQRMDRVFRHGSPFIHRMGNQQASVASGVFACRHVDLPVAYH